MSKTNTDKEVYKQNLIKLLKHHKKNCNNPNCNLSVSRIRKSAEIDGIEFTKEEEKIFI